MAYDDSSSCAPVAAVFFAGAYYLGKLRGLKSPASSAGTSMEANLKHITVTLATWDAVWEVYLDPKWEVSLLLPQRVVLAGLLAWRDDVCRALDESGGYVLPKAQLLLLAKNMPEEVRWQQG
ncbi:HRDC domain-containing protein [Haematococcus lacustris]|uniref:HRDC domain-containing protein n=1 Tax=Haematococcus lacustris TaxID=44745 RepID=A0A699YR28_HAELA|nr:HRDC domain-containing protein [Haematococcus lacustris]